MTRTDTQFALFPELPSGVARKRRRARVFFALWPDAPTRSRLAQAATLIAPGFASHASPVKPDRYHLTLEFLGELDATRIDAALKAGDAVRAGGFDLRLDTIGHFSGANVAWIGPSRCPPPLAALKAELDRELLHLSLPVSSEVFVPHVTCVRGVREAPDAPALQVDWPVREFALVRNSMASGRARYTVLKRWPLAR